MGPKTTKTIIGVEEDYNETKKGKKIVKEI
jgi:hypothetical protein